MERQAVDSNDQKLHGIWDSLKENWQNLVKLVAVLSLMLSGVILSSYFSLNGYSPQNMSITDLLNISLVLHTGIQGVALLFVFGVMSYTFIPINNLLFGFVAKLNPEYHKRLRQLDALDYILCTMGLFLLCIMVHLTFQSGLLDRLAGLIACCLVFSSVIWCFRSESATDTPSDSHLRKNIASALIVVMLMMAPFFLIPEFGQNVLNQIMIRSGIRVEDAAITVSSEYGDHIAQTLGKSDAKTFFEGVTIPNNVLGSNKLIIIENKRFVIPHGEAKVAF